VEEESDSSSSEELESSEDEIPLEFNETEEGTFGGEFDDEVRTLIEVPLIFSFQELKKWSGQPRDVPFEEFLNETGPKNGDSVETELDAFILMFPTSIMDIMVRETNSFASSTEIGWNEVTHDEMWCYIGCLLFMGLVRLNAIDSFWCKDINGQPFIRSLLKKKRFEEIHRNLHFSDNGT